MPHKKKAGFCVSFFAHGGASARQIEETDDIVQMKKKLQAESELYYVACDVNKKTAIKKYNDLVKKNKRKYTKKRKSVKRKSVKRHRRKN